MRRNIKKGKINHADMVMPVDIEPIKIDGDLFGESYKP